MRIYKTIEVDVSETVDVEICLSTNEVSRFIEQCSADEKNEILKCLKLDCTFNEIEIKTIEDEAKAAALIVLFNKYSSSELEALTNNKLYS